MKKLFIIFFIPLISFGQNLSNEETELYNLIMQYRSSKGLPRIPLSKSLTFVAQTHVRDLENNKSDVGNCNMHSWSNKGPAELCYGSSGGSVTPLEALNGWKGSSGHNAVVINQGVWKESWKAIGIGLYKGFAVVWFGHERDHGKVIRTQIDGVFKGWDGKTVFEMRNGQVWQQSTNKSLNHRSNSPEVLIYEVIQECSWIMSVKDVNQTIVVVQINDSYKRDQNSLNRETKGGYIYTVVRGPRTQDYLIVEKNNFFYLMKIINGGCCTMGTMMFDETTFNLQNVFVKQWPNAVYKGFQMKIIEKNNSYGVLNNKLKNLLLM